MPLCPCGAATKSSSWRLPVVLGLDGELDVRPVEAQHHGLDASAEQLRAMSARVTSSAVAVSAMIGTLGKISRSRDSASYSGRNAGPHCEMQCASSIAIRRTSSLRQRFQHALRHQPLGRQIEQARLARRGAAPGGDILVARRGRN